MQQTLANARTREDAQDLPGGADDRAMNPHAGHTFTREQLSDLSDLVKSSGTLTKRNRKKPARRRETAENVSTPPPALNPTGPPAPLPKEKRDTASGLGDKNI